MRYALVSGRVVATLMAQAAARVRVRRSGARCRRAARTHAAGLLGSPARRDAGAVSRGSPAAAPQERFARKNEAEDLRRAFEHLDAKQCVPVRRVGRSQPAARGVGGGVCAQAWRTRGGAGDGGARLRSRPDPCPARPPRACCRAPAGTERLTRRSLRRSSRSSGTSASGRVLLLAASAARRAPRWGHRVPSAPRALRPRRLLLRRRTLTT